MDEVVAACRESTLLEDQTNITRAIVARATGDLRRCIDLTLELVNSPAALTVRDAVGLSMAALLAREVAPCRGPKQSNTPPGPAVNANGPATAGPA